MMQEMWTILRILNWTKAYFEDKGIESPRLDAELLLCAVLGMRRIDLYTHFDQPLEKEELAAYRGYVMRRAKREPVAYILGEKGFLDYTFAVTADTLIPRPETELLVEKILAVTADGPLDILELGVGSGAILISLLLKRKEAQGLGAIFQKGLLRSHGRMPRIWASRTAVKSSYPIFLKRCLKAASLISSFPIHPTFPKRIWPAFLRKCGRNPWAHLTAGKTALIFTVASCGKAWLILRKMACLLLKWALVKARLLQTFLFKTAAARPASFLTMRGLTAWS